MLGLVAASAIVSRTTVYFKLRTNQARVDMYIQITTLMKYQPPNPEP